MADHHLIKEINRSTDRWRLIVRVDRKWEIYPKSSPTELFAISMVLIDEEGSKIQAIVKHKSLHCKWKETAHEGRVYYLANFGVEDNDAEYRPTTHPYRLTISSTTHIQEEEAPVPEYSYNFMLLPDVLKIKDKKDVPHLIDVLAFVKEIGDLEEYGRDDVKKNKLRMVLTDNIITDVECVLWDECSEEAYASYLRNSKPPVVVILSYTRIGFSEDGVAQVHNSYNATGVEFNSNIKEVRKFIKSNSDGKSPIVSPLSRPFPSRHNRQSSTANLSFHPRISISAIGAQPKGNDFVICAEFLKLETIHNWVYDGCSKCSAKLKEDEGDLICPLCKKKPNAVEAKLKLHYTVSDESGSCSVVFWDKEATQLVTKTAMQLKFLLAEKNTPHDIPDEVEEVLGKRAILKLRKNKYNIDHPNSSISVMQYMICDDLLGDFEQVASDGDDDDDPSGSKVSKKKVMRSAMKKKAETHESPTLSDKEEITVLDDDEDEDVPLAQLTRNDSEKKGRKACFKKRSSKATASKEVMESPTKPKSDKRVRKVKQE